MNDLLDILKHSVGPVVLISGVGLIILAQTNRMGSLISRIRWIKKSGASGPNTKAQILQLYRRAKVIRYSLIALICCIFFDSLIILSIFSFSLLQLHSEVLVILLFLLTLISLIVGLAFFIYDVNLNLKAIQIEVEKP